MVLPDISFFLFELVSTVQSVILRLPCSLVPTHLVGLVPTNDSCMNHLLQQNSDFSAFISTAICIGTNFYSAVMTLSCLYPFSNSLFRLTISIEIHKFLKNKSMCKNLSLLFFLMTQIFPKCGKPLS